MKKIVLVSVTCVTLFSMDVSAEGYQDGWKVYERPQPGRIYGGVEANPYGQGGGKSFGAGGGQSYGQGGGNSYGFGGGKNPANPWRVTD